MREWLKSFRDKANFTQAELALRTGTTQQMINFVENEKRRPSPQLAKKIAEALGFDWTRFYEENENTDNASQAV